MIAISKSEKEIIAKRFPNVHIVRTMKQRSKRHRYYCEETTSVMKFLNRTRSQGAVTANNGKDTNYANRAKGKRN